MKAHDLFNKFGVRSITMDEIANQLGISKKTIYQYFADKDELVDAATVAHINKNTLRCNADRDVSENAIHEIFLIIVMVQEMLSNMSATIFYDLEKFYPKTFAKFNAYRNTYLYDVVYANLERGIKESLYRPELQLDIITKLRLEVMFLPFNQNVFPTGKYNVATIEKELLEHYLYGVATTKAHKIIDKYKRLSE